MPYYSWTSSHVSKNLKVNKSKIWGGVEDVDFLSTEPSRLGLGIGLGSCRLVKMSLIYLSNSVSVPQNLCWRKSNSCCRISGYVIMCTHAHTACCSHECLTLKGL